MIPATGERIARSTPPQRAVIQLAHDKAAQIAQAHPECLVVGAGTVVVLDGAILGKLRMRRKPGGCCAACPAGRISLYRRLPVLRPLPLSVGGHDPGLHAAAERRADRGVIWPPANPWIRPGLCLQGRAGRPQKLRAVQTMVIGLPLHLVLRMARALEAATGKKIWSERGCGVTRIRLF